jgi:hypothetical protein
MRRPQPAGRPSENETVTSGNGVLKILLSEGFPETSDGPTSVQMLSTAEIATGCFFTRFVATLPLVTASFSLGQLLRRKGLSTNLMPFHLGPKFVADFEELTDPEEREFRQRDAYERVHYFLEKLGMA